MAESWRTNAVVVTRLLCTTFGHWTFSSAGTSAWSDQSLSFQLAVKYKKKNFYIFNMLYLHLSQLFLPTRLIRKVMPLLVKVHIYEDDVERWEARVSALSHWIKKAVISFIKRTYLYNIMLAFMALGKSYIHNLCL